MEHVLHENRGHPCASRTHLLRPRGPRTDETVDARRPEHRQCDARPRPSRNRVERNAQGGEEDHGIHDPGGLVPAAVAAGLQVDGKAMRGQMTFTLAPKEGGTEVRYDAQMAGKGLFRLTSGMMNRMMAEEDHDILDRLRGQVERGR